jgi:hypothetical protein
MPLARDWKATKSGLKHQEVGMKGLKSGMDSNIWTSFVQVFEC